MAYNRAYPDRYSIATLQERFEPVLAEIPAAASVGYVTDLSPKDVQSDVIFDAAQLALAPRVVLPIEKSASEWIVGTVLQGTDPATIATSRGLHMVRNYGNGVVLYRRSVH
jgi:hypothetical protein